MRNLFTFLWKNYFFLLFILLEAVAFVLISRNNYYQRTVMINSTNDFTGTLLETYSGFTEYFHLKEANRELAEENARLLNRRPEAFIITDTNIFFVDDSLYNRQFSYMPARVISNSINRRNNYMKLNKGSIHGVQPDMAVIAPGGVAGQVIEVSPHFSSVMSVINMNTRLSARLKTSGQVGTLKWDGENYRTGLLVDIPSHVSINVGDTVVTSGFSQIYPRNEMIGVVEDFSIGQGDNFYRVKIRFAVDYNQLRHVFIVKNLFQDELMMLEQTEITE
ncbi:MAG: rod shape-determining protein MreC [Bacteroidales bacterium]